jgi:hypothetical protein
MIEILDKEILVSTAHTSLVLSHRYAEKLVISYYGQKLISSRRSAPWSAVIPMVRKRSLAG